MTSEQRSKIAIFALVIIAICGYGKSVKVWTPQDAFAIVEAGAIALVAGITKSPRDAALSDQATGESGDSKVTSVTTTDTHEEIKQPGGKNETNPDTTEPPAAAATAVRRAAARK